jgi:hypothetical protein
MATIATLSVDVGVGKNDITAFLQQLQSQLQAADAAAQKAAASIGSAFGNVGGLNASAVGIRNVGIAAQQAANDELRLAQAEARGLTTKGQLAAASQRLSSAIQQYSQVADSSAASILRLQNAENQLATVQAKIQTSAAASASSLSSLQTAFEGMTTAAATFGIGLGIQELVRLGSDAISSANSLEKAEAVTRALSGSQEKYNQVLATARRGQQLYGGSLEDNIRGLGSLVNISNRYSVELQKIDNLARRLALVDPEQGIKGANFALKEFLSGSGAQAGRSLVQRFEIPKNLIDPFGNADPSTKVAALDAALNKLGITQEVLSSQSASNAAKFDRFSASVDNLKVALGGVAAVQLGPTVEQATRFTNALQGSGTAFDIIQSGNAVVQGLGSTFGSVLGPLGAYNSAVIGGIGGLLGFSSANQQATGALIQKSAADIQAAQTAAALETAEDAVAQRAAAASAVFQQLAADIQTSAQQSVEDAAQKNLQAEKTQLLGIQANATANEFIANLNPGMSASAAASAAAAAGLSPLISQLVGVQVEASKARAELLALNNQKQTAAVNQAIALNRATGQIGRGDAGDTRLDREAVGKQLADQRNAEINLAQAQNNHAREIALLKNAQVGLNKDSADYINLQAKIVKAEDDAAKAGKKKAAGTPGISNVRLTDQQKLQNSLLANQESFANKAEDEETKHQKKLVDIDTQYAQRRAEVDKKFHLDRLQGEADFYEGLSSIKDRGVQKQIDAQYQQALLKAEEIARTKGGDAANAFLDAQTSIIQKRGSLLDKIAGLTDKKGKDKQTQQSDANQAEYLRGVLALQERASALKLQQVEGEGSQIANERQRQLADENAHFQDAMNQLGVKAEDAATTRINASIRAAKQIDTETLSVDNLGAAYNRVARGTSTTGTATTGTPVTDAVQAVTNADVTKTNEGGNPVVAALNSAASAIVAAIGAVERAENNTTRAVRGISVSPLVTR